MDDGKRIAITVYSSDKRIALATLITPSAVQLAHRLLDTAARRL
jgi:hypothetical protein